MMGRGPLHRTVLISDWIGSLGELELLRLGREGSEGMYSLQVAAQHTEQSSYQGLTAKEQKEMGTS